MSGALGLHWQPQGSLSLFWPRMVANTPTLHLQVAESQPAGSFLSSKIDILEERFLGGDLC